MSVRMLLASAWLATSAAAALAAPDEQALGREAGYPAGANLQQAYQQPYLVGSFSAMDSIAPSCRQAPAAQPVPLPAADPETQSSSAAGRRTSAP